MVTAVASTDEDGEQPSRFLQELFPDHPDHRIQHRPGRPARPLSMPGLVAELRRTLADETQPSPLRTAAALRLARLTAAHRRHEVWAPMADPATWWGTRDWTVSAVPVAPTDRPVVLTASTLTGLEGCPARWFLEREAGGATVSTQAQGFGNVVHALADRIGRGEEPVTPDLVDRLMGEVDRVWPRIPFRTPWSGDGERAAARDALTRFLAHHQRPDAREVIGTEQALRADLRLPDGTEIRLTGYADRLELDGDGRVVVVDLKTGKSVPTQSEVAIHPQLGFYQLAVEHGAVPGHAETGGAELWHLRSEASGRMRVQAQSPQQPDGDGLRAIDRQLATAAAALRDERFPARPHNDCHRCPFVRSCPAHHAGTVLS